MTILCKFGIGGYYGRLRRVQGWALGRLISVDYASADLRWAVVALLSRGLTAAWSSLVRNIAGRAWQGARFAADMSAADTTVAAAGR
jgi:hypothetical protein